MHAESDSSPLESLHQEHRLIERGIEAFEEYARRFDAGEDVGRADLGAFVAFFSEFAELTHHAKEEDILLPAMVEHGFAWNSGAVAKVRSEHDQERYLVDVLRQAAEQGGDWTEEDTRHAVAAMKGFIRFQREHMNKEEAILYPAAEERLSDDEMACVQRKLRRFDEEHEATSARGPLRDEIERLVRRYAPI